MKQNKLWTELGCMTLASLIVYTVLFVVLWLIERWYPQLQGTLLQWDNLSWIVGIPASVLGTAYVLTIRNPQNYTGFYLGVLMSLLLAWQFALQGSWDLVVMYVAVFVPFLIKSIVEWKKGAGDLVPAFLPVRRALLTILVFAVGVVIDYLFAHSWVSAVMVVSPIMANFLMIYKKNDAWIFWILYCVSGLVLFIGLGNAFSIVLFSVMLLVNLSGQIAWFRMTKKENFGWLSCVMN